MHAYLISFTKRKEVVKNQYLCQPIIKTSNLKEIACDRRAHVKYSHSGVMLIENRVFFDVQRVPDLPQRYIKSHGHNYYKFRKFT